MEISLSYVEFQIHIWDWYNVMVAMFLPVELRWPHSKRPNAGNKCVKKCHICGTFFSGGEITCEKCTFETSLVWKPRVWPKNKERDLFTNVWKPCFFHIIYFMLFYKSSHTLFWGAPIPCFKWLQQCNEMQSGIHLGIKHASTLPKSMLKWMSKSSNIIGSVCRDVSE